MATLYSMESDPDSNPGWEHKILSLCAWAVKLNPDSKLNKQMIMVVTGLESGIKAGQSHCVDHRLLC